MIHAGVFSEAKGEKGPMADNEQRQPRKERERMKTKQKKAKTSKRRNGKQDGPGKTQTFKGSASSLQDVERVRSTHWATRPCIKLSIASLCCKSIKVNTAMSALNGLSRGPVFRLMVNHYRLYYPICMSLDLYLRWLINHLFFHDSYHQISSLPAYTPSCA